MGLITTNNAMPFVNLNGNSRMHLTREWSDFYVALRDALQKFPHDSFHGRNHYCKPTDSDANHGCKRAMETALAQLKSVADEVHETLIVEGRK